MTSDFVKALANLPTCDASGVYPTNRPTDLDSVLINERVQRMGEKIGAAQAVIDRVMYRAHFDANI